MSNLVAISAEPAIVFTVEGTNWVVRVPFDEIYEEMDSEEVLLDICTRTLNFLLFDNSTEKLENEIIGNKLDLGIILAVYIDNPNKINIIPVWKVLSNCSKSELADKYFKKLEEVTNKE